MESYNQNTQDVHRFICVLNINDLYTEVASKNNLSIYCYRILLESVAFLRTRFYQIVLGPIESC